MRVLLLNEEGIIVACLMEYDIMSQGSTPQVALVRLRRAMTAQALWDRLDDKRPFSDTPPISETYQQVYDRAEPWEGVRPVGCRDWEIRSSNEVLPETILVGIR
jgi:hypothetical protein